MDPQSEIRRLKRQRNLASVIAVAIIAVGMTVCVPRGIERRKRLRAADDELIALQARIEDTQNQIRGVQAQIIQTQADIRSLTHERQ
jgi:CHASE1-domain containing sensor protein